MFWQCFGGVTKIVPKPAADNTAKTHHLRLLKMGTVPIYEFVEENG